MSSQTFYIIFLVRVGRIAPTLLTGTRIHSRTQLFELSSSGQVHRLLQAVMSNFILFSLVDDLFVTVIIL